MSAGRHNARELAGVLQRALETPIKAHGLVLESTVFGWTRGERFQLMVMLVEKPRKDKSDAR